MSTDRQRDADIDRLLRATLRQKADPPAGECPDLGVFAAYVEGSAPPDERGRLETHMAACSRCQAVMAILAADEPASEVVREAAAQKVAWQPHWWSRVHPRWFVPVTAIATILVIYVATRPLIAPYFPTVSPGPELSQAPSSPAIPPAADERVAERMPPETPTAKGTPEPESALRERDRLRTAEQVPAQPTLASREARPAPGGVSQTLPPAPPVEIAAANLQERAEQLARREKGAAAPMAAVPMAAPAPVATPLAVPAAAPAAAPEPRPAPPVAVAPDQAGAARPAAVDAMRDAATGGGQKIDAQRETADYVLAVTPGSHVRWRLGSFGYIARSDDGGATWFAQKSGVSVALLAGSAPSDAACWAVGVAGTVLVTDDGERWSRRTFPEQVDLVAVDARSARVATVTPRDGPRFPTSDGGRTW
ncbi:MAG: zf-HC2 domain-containing protein, partial [Acidobacteria bacterium]|nr:zf-HC2 domain-containing protein [Acidobacteriota bacterium]